VNDRHQAVRGAKVNAYDHILLLQAAGCYIDADLCHFYCYSRGQQK
jgi:hypothetical protein